ncbi:hypothetical protein ACNKHK_00190 [Shigella flexneri]
MAIGRTQQEALQKALRGLEWARPASTESQPDDPEALTKIRRDSRRRR